jgi:hypothetical protein
VTEVLLPIALLAGGLAAGVLVGTVLGGVPLFRSLPADRYVEVHQFLARRYEPFQPICLAVTFLADAVLVAGVTAAIPRLLFGLAVVLTAAAMAVSLTRNVPLKRWVLSLDPRALPRDWNEHDPRRTWAAWNLVRTVLVVAALGLNAAAVGILLRGAP